MGQEIFLKYLKLFGLSKVFTEKELKEAYRDLAHVWHPDKYNHNERLRIKAEKQIQEVNEGYEYLTEMLKSGFPSSFDSFSESTYKPYSNAQESRPDHKSNGTKDKNEKKYQPAPSNKSAKSGFLTLIALIIVIIVFVLLQKFNSNYSKQNPSYEIYETEREISKKLDQKNGFKIFQFGMSVTKAERIKKPTDKKK